MKKSTKLALGTAGAAALGLAAVLQYPKAITKKKRIFPRPRVLSEISGIAKANPRLADLMWLASHDSFSDQITRSSKMDPVEIKKGSPFALPGVIPLTKGIAARFSRAQNLNAMEQLNAGARMLDIRLTWYNNTYYTRHSIISGPFEPYLRQILRFLADIESPGEIVFLYFLDIVLPEGKTKAHTLNWLAEIRENGKNIFDYVPYSTLDAANEPRLAVDLRCNEVTNGGAQSGAVIFMREKELPQEPYFDKIFSLDASFHAPWANQVRDSKMTAFYAEREAEAAARRAAGETDKFYIMQAQKTPCFHTAADAIGAVRGWSLLDIAAHSNARLIEEGILDRWFNGDFQVILVDNVNCTRADFNYVINKKLHMYNAAVVERLQP